MSAEVFHVWTVYDRPLDFPDSIVVRRFDVRPGSEPQLSMAVVTFPTIEAARAWLAEKHLYRIPRSQGDEPQIVESWI